MQVFLVGGAVRDALLGLEVTDRDWVVVGSSPEQMQALGYLPVGKDFPVFLHPKTKEEYALARTERKQGRGYKGFVFNASPKVSLQEDLERRDLTINALAQDENGKIIDFHGGQKDLRQKVLRAVSPAFSEDPLRVLRVARFAARFAHLGFSIAENTLQLMRYLSQTGELNTLSAERVWQEIAKSLATPQPQVFWQVLLETQALEHLCPSLAQHLTKQPQINQQPQNLVFMQRLAALGLNSELIFASLSWQGDASLLKNLNSQFLLPKKFQRACQLLKNLQEFSACLKKPNAECLMQLFNLTDAWRQPENLSAALNAMAIFLPADFLPADFLQADCLQAENPEKNQEKQENQEKLEESLEIKIQLIQEALRLALEVKAQHLVAAGLKGPALGAALAAQRQDVIHRHLGQT